MNAALSNLCISAVVAAVAIAAYDRFVVRPSQRVGVVDVLEVYRVKEAQFAEAVAKATTDADRQQAMLLAREFSKRLPAALDELPVECGCLVVVKSALAGSSRHVVDLTALLKRKVGAS